MRASKNRYRALLYNSRRREQGRDGEFSGKGPYYLTLHTEKWTCRGGTAW